MKLKQRDIQTSRALLSLALMPLLQPTGIVARHENTLEHLRAENMQLVKKLSRAEVAADTLKEEKLILKVKKNNEEELALF